MAGLLDFDLNDPKTMGLLNLGLGILAGNTGRPGDLGQGVMQGMGNFQAMQQQAQMNQMRQQQADMQRTQMEREAAQYQRQQDAMTSLFGSDPQLAAMAALDPKAALKAAYPNMASADPYFSPIYDQGGAYTFNHRTGMIAPLTTQDGKPLIRPADSPNVRGAVKSAEAFGAAQWKPNTDIDGQVMTDAQVAQMATGALPTNNFKTPYPVTFGAPGTTETDRREGTMTEASVALRDPSRPQARSPAGISVPTKAEQAAAEKEAVIAAEKRAESRAGLNQMMTQAQESLDLIDQMVGSADGRVPRHPGFESAVGLSSRLDPRNYVPGTDASDFNIRLDQMRGKQFLQAFESLKGGGAITQIEGEKATNAIARMNTAASEKEFVKAARDFQTVVRNAMNTARSKAEGGTQKTRRFNPKTGRIE